MHTASVRKTFSRRIYYIFSIEPIAVPMLAQYFSVPPDDSLLQWWTVWATSANALCISLRGLVTPKLQLPYATVHIKLKQNVIKVKGDTTEIYTQSF